MVAAAGQHYRGDTNELGLVRQLRRASVLQVLIERASADIASADMPRKMHAG